MPPNPLAPPSSPNPALDRTDPPPPIADDAAQVLIDRHGIVRYWSAGCAALFGHAGEALVGAPLDAIIPPALRAGHRAGVAAAMAMVGFDREAPVGNIPVVHADGAVRRHPFRQLQLCDPFGRSTGAVVTFLPAVAPGGANGLRDVFDLPDEAG